MSALDVHIEGIGLWAPGWPDWDSACVGLRRGEAPRADAPARPAPGLLPPAERRRAPDPVLIACEVAAQACDAAGRDPAALASVFTSTHGDTAITDYMCETLARAPHELSPIRFHNSVHNAPAGYWTIAAHCHAASTSISGYTASFAGGLLEAAAQALSADEPVLLVAYDIVSQGALAEVVPSAPAFGIALVLAPWHGDAGLPRLQLALEAEATPTRIALPSAFATIANGNPMAASALPFATALVSDVASSLVLPLGAREGLKVTFS
ncbi:MAG TPA: beta-ketoacyl synthase chain length factor [Dokdonella sp.]|uniref:beta-ketoacyl synthase chain length factor n=1 Tax=Dokdonella sp. TaxID=2291710 RepID=UPI0025BD6CD9|nr:beta-ketoacyl synthase chain length factor [Dokdonella sp.]MBX3691272.1 beta-ketoacyl synthase chain length factor [Dokdonella sp.]MCW5567880.1 beta-ketoacyl synthase chain length factor [Dokdonella sp.]HNR91389.1 beta-ketoacyl synthase chain length factor [Dokdonella sp.]